MTEENSGPAPVSGGKGRRGWSSVKIRTKLTVMLLIPALALAGMVGVRLYESATEAQAVTATAEVVELTGIAADTIHAVQRERLAAAMLVFQENTGLSDPETLMSSFEAAEAATDEQLALLEEARSTTDMDSTFTDLLLRVDKPLDRLVTARESIHGSTVAEVHLTVYNSLVTRLSAVLDRAVDAADTAELSRHLRTASLLHEIDENSAQMQILVLGLEDGEPLAEDYRPFMRLATSREAALVEYRRLVAESDPNAAVFEVGGLGAAPARPANRLDSQVSSARSDDEQEIQHDSLMLAYDARHAATATLVDESVDATVDIAGDIREAVVQRLLIEGAATVLALAIAVLIGFGIGRSVTRGLRDLSDSARRIAMVDLPNAVRHVDEQEGLGGLSAAEFAARTTPPLQTKGDNELSEVGEAFNIVHREAIRVAAQQAVLRFHIGSIFVRLARRGNSLTGRLTAELDEAERNEQDPDRLSRLFRLDHLISLVSRANDSLLVLGGASAAKVRTNDAKLGDVLTAAQSRIEYYTRIELAADEGAWVRAEVVDDVVQLLAELMDNATRYSESTAEVMARVLTGRAVIEVRDRGIGIDPMRMSQLNERLRAHAAVDLDAMQAMGLTVVGHLASRHGIEVELRPSLGGGTVAEIAVPGSILAFGKPSRPAKPIAAFPGGTPVEEEPLIRRRNAPLFDQKAAAQEASVEDSPTLRLPKQRNGIDEPVPPPPPAVRPEPRALSSTAEPLRPLTALESAAGPSTERVPALTLDVRYLSADPSLRAGSAMPMADPMSMARTVGGLPKRDPMSNLVPGAVEPTPGRTGAPIQRDARTIGATYSAYARGLSGSRQKSSPTNDTRTSP
ncbi:sensor histidine kinase [Glycomyces harbinensis]|uniref:histidine kinase n=1 Tax=Glycomyces harbinensis TaxID=58114 RepID=A0A1G6U3R8_9ACTN|nr:ATP-binding protein [Glycomyces harbinensis]SDD36040.1 Signal transduction histidine kinase [Glycomyces harbinensis]